MFVHFELPLDRLDRSNVCQQCDARRARCTIPRVKFREHSDVSFAEWRSSTRNGVADALARRPDAEAWLVIDSYDGASYTFAFRVNSTRIDGTCFVPIEDGHLFMPGETEEQGLRRTARDILRSFLQEAGY
jgi:hypothetical protein